MEKNQNILSKSAEKAIRLKYYHKIKPNLSTDNEAYKGMVDELFEEMKQDGCVTVPPQKKYLERKHKNYLVILVNLVDTYLYDPELYVGYNRNENKYKRDRKYKGFQFSYDRVREFTDFLERYGYIEQDKGYVSLNDDKDSHISKMRCTDRLAKLLDRHVLMLHQQKDFDYDYTHEETVVVKGKKPKPYWGTHKGKRKLIKPKRKIVKTPNTPAVRQMHENLSKINAVMHEADITLDITAADLRELNLRMASSPDQYKQPVDFRRKYLHRVFLDGRLDLGGRYYGAWYQNIPKEYREWIAINGVPVVEPDFPSYHPRILYNAEGHDMQAGDLYQLDGFPADDDTRDFLKTVLLTAINAADENSACDGIRGKVHKSRKEAWNKGEKTPILPVDNLDNATLKPIIKKFREKHHKIAHYICADNKDTGNKLQYIDSQLTEYILMHFADKGIACLPMHDSYMVAGRYLEELTDVMPRVYTEGLKIGTDELLEIQLKADVKTSTAFLRATEVFLKKANSGEISPEELAEFQEEIKELKKDYNAMMKKFEKKSE